MGLKKPNINRRHFLQASIGAALGGSLLNSQQVLAATPTSQANSQGNSKDNSQIIKIAGYDYDRVLAIKDGRVGIESAEVSFDTKDIYAVSRHAFGPNQKYEVTELGLIPFIRMYINKGYRDYTLIPIFISRTFRHRNIFVHVDSGINKPEDLRGKTVGTPGYAFSANTWIRGFLLDEHGIKADDMQWIETTESSDGGIVNQKLNRYFLPDDFPLTKGPAGIDESELLLSGGCDALITAITPKSFLEGNPNIKRLFPDVKAAEQSYYKNTGVFPIMHAVAIRKDAIAKNPSLPKDVFNMYSQAKNIAYDRLQSTTSLKVTLPWVADEFEATQKLMGDNFWRYGFEANHRELELVMRYVHEQSLTKRQIAIEKLFHPSTLELMDG